jgi:hypothetical protein
MCVPVKRRVSQARIVRQLLKVSRADPVAWAKHVAWGRVLEIAHGMAQGPRELLRDDAIARSRANLADAEPLWNPDNASTWNPLDEMAKAREDRKAREQARERDQDQGAE